MRRHWWHDALTGTFYAVATDEDGQIVSAWMQVDAHHWVSLDRFAPLRRADKRGEIHRNDAEGGWTDELSHALGAVQ